MSRTPRDSQPLTNLFSLIEEKKKLDELSAELQSEIAGQIKKFRRANSLTQADLAAGISRSQAYVSMVENETRTPSEGFVTSFLAFASSSQDDEGEDDGDEEASTD